MERIDDGDLSIVIAGPAGFGNNIYIVVDRATDAAAFVDAPDELEKSLAAAEAAGARPTAILLTHSHADHTASIDALKAAFGCVVYGDSREPWLKPGQLDHPVGDGDEVRVGGL